MGQYAHLLVQTYLLCARKIAYFENRLGGDQQNLENRKSAMSNSPAPRLPVRRGRPRYDTVHQAALEATFCLLSSTGFEKLTMEAIAREAHLSKPTLYRRWPGKGPLVLEAMMARSPWVPNPQTLPEAPLKDRLAAWLGELFETLESGPEGHILRQLVAAAQADAEFAQQFREGFVAPRRQSVRELLELAQAKGELPPQVDLETLIDLLYGPMWYRLLFGHAPLSRSFAHELVERVLG